MRRPAGHALNGLLDVVAVAATGAFLQRAPLPGIARFAATPVLLRLVRNRGVRNIALAIAGIGVLAALLSDRADPDPEEWTAA